MDLLGWSRKKAVLVNFVAILLLSAPCALGFNLWSGFTVLGMDISTIEDFLVSQNILPLGSLLFVLFCVSKKGWGWDNFIKEANTGIGLKVKPWMKPLFQYIVPAIIAVIYIYGIVTFRWK